MKKILSIAVILLSSLAVYSQIEIKGFKVGGLVKVDGLIMNTKAETTIMGEDVTISFEGKDLANRIVELGGWYLEITEYSFSLSYKNTEALIDALQKKYGGEISRDGNITLTTYDSKVVCIGWSEKYKIKVTKQNSKTDINDL